MNKDIEPHQPEYWHINKLRSKGSVSSSLCLSVMTAHYIAMRWQGERQLALMVRENGTHAVYELTVFELHTHTLVFDLFLFLHMRTK